MVYIVYVRTNFLTDLYRVRLLVGRSSDVRRSAVHHPNYRSLGNECTAGWRRQFSKKLDRGWLSCIFRFFLLFVVLLGISSPGSALLFPAACWAAPLLCTERVPTHSKILGLFAIVKTPFKYCKEKYRGRNPAGYTR